MGGAKINIPAYAVNSLGQSTLEQAKNDPRYTLGDKNGKFRDENTQKAFEEWLARDAWGTFKRNWKNEQREGEKNG